MGSESDRSRNEIDIRHVKRNERSNRNGKVKGVKKGHICLSLPGNWGMELEAFRSRVGGGLGGRWVGV